jgi:predicted nucleic acid-binding protein
VILADTSAWVEFLRATGSPAHLRLRELIAGEGDLATTDVVAMELLAGTTTHDAMTQLRRMLLRFQHLPVEGLADHEAAADLYRRCRAGGETVRKLTDCLIAVVAVRTEPPCSTATKTSRSSPGTPPCGWPASRRRGAGPGWRRRPGRGGRRARRRRRRGQPGSR